MREALDLALQGRYGASPNPMVGAVVTDPSGAVVGRGWHRVCGGPHAEVYALDEAGPCAVGGTLWVTLEPCAHHGRTPPCCERVIASGVQRVVVAMRDPNPEAAGGVERLRAAGLEVTVGHHEDEARRLNRRWLRSVGQDRPWITQKFAVSLDGRIATRTGQSKWITGEAARRRSLELREEHDAILVGLGTVLADDPRLTRRLGLNSGSGWRRVVLDSLLQTPSTSRVVVDDPETTILVHTPAAGESDRARLEASGADLWEVRADGSGRVDLTDLLPRLLRRASIGALLVEGGAEVHGSFNDLGLTDEIVLFVAPLVFGGAAPPAVSGEGAAAIAEANRFVFEQPVSVGDDLEIHAVRSEDVDLDEGGPGDLDVHRPD